MFIRIALLLMSAAFALFLSVDLLLWLAMPGLAGLMSRLGLSALLSGFALLLANGLWGLLKRIVAACAVYFSAKARLQRRLWFVQNRETQLKQLFYFRTAQINYVHGFKRKQLLRANNKRHIRALASAIDKDLQAIRQRLPKTTYRQLRQENVRCQKQQDVEALLKLQQKIGTIV